jgi:hypothetical protein
MQVVAMTRTTKEKTVTFITVFLVIRWSLIRGFDYPRLVFAYKIRRYFPRLHLYFAFFMVKMDNKMPKQWSTITRGFSIGGVF